MVTNCFWTASTMLTYRPTTTISFHVTPHFNCYTLWWINVVGATCSLSIILKNIPAVLWQSLGNKKKEEATYFITFHTTFTMFSDCNDVGILDFISCIGWLKGTRVTLKLQKCDGISSPKMYTSIYITPTLKDIQHRTYSGKWVLSFFLSSV